MQYIKKYWIVIVIVFSLSVFIKPALCFLILGSVISYCTIASMRVQRRLANNGTECTGRIVSFEADGDGGKTPVIEFTPTGGTVITEKPFVYTGTDLSNIRSYDSLLGNEVQIVYDPDDPKKFILAQEKGSNVFVLSLFFLACLGLIAVGIASLVGYVKLR